MVNGSWHGSIDQFLFDLKTNQKNKIPKIKNLSSGVTRSKI